MPDASGVRLSSTTVVEVPAASRLPRYDRSVTPHIVHVGVGGFARAHLCVYADDLRQAGWPAMVRGVSLRSARAERQLGPQDGLYSVTEREPDGSRPPRIIGAVASVETGREPAVRAIVAPTTELVTVTVTEKGYQLDPDDLVDLDRPRSAPAVIAHGLFDRYRASDGRTAPVVAALDNVWDNGRVLRARVVEVAERLDPAFARWVIEGVSFPSSVVDRMVPATTRSDLDDVARRLGLRDEGAVVAEHHRSWVIEAVDGLPPLADVGVQVVGDIGPFQRRKLWLLNGLHSAVAYAGLLAGCDTIAAASAHPVVAAFVGRVVDDVLAVVDLPPSAEPGAFAAESLRRFANPALGHTCRQVGADGSEKLRQRLLPVVAARHARHLSTDRLAVVVALWLAAAAEVPVRGVALPVVEDPLGADLRRVGSRLAPASLAATGLGSDASDAFVAQVAATLERLTRHGLDLLRDDR